jgi:hypothetical protein
MSTGNLRRPAPFCTCEGADTVLDVSSQAEVGEPFDDGRHRFSALW